MWPGRYFTPRYWAERFWAKSGSDEAPPTVFGRLEYTVPYGLLHYTVPQDVEYTVPKSEQLTVGEP